MCILRVSYSHPPTPIPCPIPASLLETLPRSWSLLSIGYGGEIVMRIVNMIRPPIKWYIPGRALRGTSEQASGLTRVSPPEGFLAHKDCAPCVCPRGGWGPHFASRDD